MLHQDFKYAGNEFAITDQAFIDRNTIFKGDEGRVWWTDPEGEFAAVSPDCDGSAPVKVIFLQYGSGVWYCSTHGEYEDRTAACPHINITIRGLLDDCPTSGLARRLCHLSGLLE